MNKKLILIGGYVATGKTTFSRFLSEEVQIPCYNKDTLNELVGERLTIPNVEERRNLSNASFHLLTYIADMALLTGNAVILESNFKPAEIPYMQALLDKHRCEALTYLFMGDMPTVYQRFTKREHSESRHAIHKWHSFKNLEAFQNAISPLADFRVAGRRILVDTTDFNNVDYRALTMEAQKFLSH